MTSFTPKGRIIVALAMLVPAMVSLWLMAVPDLLTPSTFATLAALNLALAAIVLNTYTSVQAPGSVGQLLYQTHSVQPAATRPTATPGVAHPRF